MRGYAVLAMILVISSAYALSFSGFTEFTKDNSFIILAVSTTLALSAAVYATMAKVREELAKPAAVFMGVAVFTSFFMTDWFYSFYTQFLTGMSVLYIGVVAVLLFLALVGFGLGNLESAGAGDVSWPGRLIIIGILFIIAGAALSKLYPYYAPFFTYAGVGFIILGVLMFFFSHHRSEGVPAEGPGLFGRLFRRRPRPERGLGEGEPEPPGEGEPEPSKPKKEKKVKKESQDMVHFTIVLDHRSSSAVQRETRSNFLIAHIEIFSDRYKHGKTHLYVPMYANGVRGARKVAKYFVRRVVGGRPIDYFVGSFDAPADSKVVILSILNAEKPFRVTQSKLRRLWRSEYRKRFSEGVAYMRRFGFAVFASGNGYYIRKALEEGVGLFTRGAVDKNRFRHIVKLDTKAIVDKVKKSTRNFTVVLSHFEKSDESASQGAKALPSARARFSFIINNKPFKQCGIKNFKISLRYDPLGDVINNVREITVSSDVVEIPLYLTVGGKRYPLNTIAIPFIKAVGRWRNPALKLYDGKSPVNLPVRVLRKRHEFIIIVGGSKGVLLKENKHYLVYIWSSI